MSDFVELKQISDWLREEEAARCSDPRNKAWAIAAAETIEVLRQGCDLLLTQYRAMDNYTMGGALTNKPFLAIERAMSRQSPSPTHDRKDGE